MTSIKHHPKTETLAAYAAGALDEARAVVIATHLDLCDACRAAARDFEALGGVCLEAAEPAPMKEGALERFWLRAGGARAERAPASTRAANDFDLGLARPLSAYLKGGLDAVQWRRIGPGMEQCVLDAQGYRKGVLRLLKIAPGVRLPKHSHGGEELTLILRGAYEDEIGEFRRGDLADLDDEDTHSPCAIGEEPCVCLIAASAPLRFKGLAGKIVQPFIGL
ncbi:ChrR family anti-sigma-E factor [Amphiplicatus metriothermophilus]|uniref:Anti-ECFsigma factor, ChrR n=1 Tax=Amphiplicatus metriothermophilus TaxID=1519374 RepID=A0A239PVB9_9PROT|nr:ChrR family anti-sigma-E factor [Amphiplicatus metriothermophilus]MBB5519686.1 putative transcriptional regulator [Amphiplicatus metriothermophilus]SNT74249.1 anti-ECFsigma factor, ChrR [Amphiplicatus metriothermophilus]